MKQKGSFRILGENGGWRGGGGVGCHPTCFPRPKIDPRDSPKCSVLFHKLGLPIHTPLSPPTTPHPPRGASPPRGGAFLGS